MTNWMNWAQLILQLIATIVPIIQAIRSERSRTTSATERARATADSGSVTVNHQAVDRSADDIRHRTLWGDLFVVALPIVALGIEFITPFPIFTHLGFASVVYAAICALAIAKMVERRKRLAVETMVRGLADYAVSLSPRVVDRDGERRK